MSEHRRVLDQYLEELQRSTFIRENTSKEEHSGHIRSLQKLAAKTRKVQDRLYRLRKYKDPNYANS